MYVYDGCISACRRNAIDENISDKDSEVNIGVYIKANGKDSSRSRASGLETQMGKGSEFTQGGPMRHGPKRRLKLAH